MIGNSITNETDLSRAYRRSVLLPDAMSRREREPTAVTQVGQVPILPGIFPVSFTLPQGAPVADQTTLNISSMMPML